MQDQNFETLRDALISARRTARPLDSAALASAPRGLAQALRLQHAVATGLGAVRGWKISGLTTEQQRDMGVECPLTAPLLAPWLWTSPAEFDLRGFIRPRLECEFAFRLGVDLPPRGEAYGRDEIDAAVAALHVVVEVVDSRLPPQSSVWFELADDLNNGAFVLGPAAPSDWRALRVSEQDIVLRRRCGSEPTEIARGNGRAVLDGDPLGALHLLANLPRTESCELRAGQVVTTGSCTGAVAVPGVGDYEADFGPFGMVALRFL